MSYYLSTNSPARGATNSGDSQYFIDATSSVASISETSLAPEAAQEWSHEHQIKRKIRKIRGNIAEIENILQSINRDVVSRKIAESLESYVSDTYAVVEETEMIFKDWIIYLAGNPLEKQKKKFTHKKLALTFQTEFDRVREIAYRVKAAATRVAGEGSRQLPSAANYDGKYNYTHKRDAGGNVEAPNPSGYSVASTTGGSARTPLRSTSYNGEDAYDEDAGEGKTSKGNAIGFESVKLIEEMNGLDEHDSLIMRDSTEERLQGLKRINAQVSQVHQVFNDLSSIVFRQDEELGTLQTNMDDTNVIASNATIQLEKAMIGVRRKRRRALITFGVIFCFILGLIMWLFRRL